MSSVNSAARLPKMCRQLCHMGRLRMRPGRNEFLPTQIVSTLPGPQGAAHFVLWSARCCALHSNPQSKPPTTHLLLAVFSRWRTLSPTSTRRRVQNWRVDEILNLWKSLVLPFREHPLYCRDDSMAFTSSNSSASLCQERVVRVERQQDPATCVLASQTKVLLPRLLAPHVVVGDEIAFPAASTETARTEICLTKRSVSGRSQSLYLAPAGHVSQPKQDKRSQYFVSAEIQHSVLGFSTVVLPCKTLREYFYRFGAGENRSDRRTLYDTLGIPAKASFPEIRVAFKLRRLELQNDGAPSEQRSALERAFNLLAHPELRACYNALLADPDAVATFPYGGFGSLLVEGEPSRDCKSFFAYRIVAFSPELHRRRFRVPLRSCDFFDGSALCRDARRKVEFWIDSAMLGMVCNSTWNQWKHLLRTKIEVAGTFVQTGKYRKRGGDRGLVIWETALPSRLQIKLPDDLQQQVEAARASHHRFGQHSRALEQIRLRLEHHALEKAELQRMCSELRIPGDFDITQISWRADYDPFFYEQLARRARRIYFFRDEYIFEIERAVVAETPQLGHATYVFSRPRSMGTFLAIYTKIAKDDIRHNRDNASERLGFVGRIIHGTNPKAWLEEIRQRVG